MHQKKNQITGCLNSEPKVADLLGALHLSNSASQQHPAIIVDPCCFLACEWTKTCLGHKKVDQQQILSVLAPTRMSAPKHPVKLLQCHQCGRGNQSLPMSMQQDLQSMQCQFHKRKDCELLIIAPMRFACTNLSFPIILFMQDTALNVAQHSRDQHASQLVLM